jgi:LysM repeat protein
MKFRQFKITEAPGDSADLKAWKAKLQAFYTTLTKKDLKDGFFANNARKNENMRLVAQFAQDNDLQSMLNPLTGKSYRFADDNDPGAGPPQPVEVSMDLPTLERMADVGELTPGVVEKLKSEAADARSGKAGLSGRTLSSLFGIEDPETADKIQNILSKNAAAADKYRIPAVPGSYPKIGVEEPLRTKPAPDDDSFDRPEPEYPKIGVEEPLRTKPEHPGKPHPKPSASTKNPDGSRVTYRSLAAASPDVDDPDKIYPGNKIKLPGGGEYIVKKGDTLSKIAQDVRLGNIKDATPTPIPTGQDDPRPGEGPTPADPGQDDPRPGEGPTPADPGQDDPRPGEGPTPADPGQDDTPDDNLPVTPPPIPSPIVPGGPRKRRWPPYRPSPRAKQGNKAPVAPKPTTTYRKDSGQVLPGGKGKDVRPPEEKLKPAPTKKPMTPSERQSLGDTLRLKYLAGIKGKNKNE